MKKIILFVLFGFFVIAGLAYAGALSLRNDLIGETLPVSEAKEKFGNQPFDEKKFKEGSTELRGAMAASLIEGKTFVGTPIASLKGRLGPHTGYLSNDMFPAYILNEGWHTSADTWQLVFLPDFSGKVKDVIINKNCCNRR